MTSTDTGSTDAGSTDAGGRFTADMARQLFSFRGKSPTGQGVDVDLVSRYYHPDVRFRDAIQEIRGRDAVIEMLLRFPQRCQELRCTVHRVVAEGDVVFVEWTTEAVIRDRIPALVDDGCSRLLIDEDGLVVDHRDYFDLWGDMIDSFPVISRPYRRLVRHLE